MRKTFAALAVAALSLGLAAPARAAIPVVDAAAIVHLIEQYRQFQTYYYTYLGELERVGHLKDYAGRYALYWALRSRRNPYGRLQPALDGLNSGDPAAIDNGYDSAAAWLESPDLDLGNTQDDAEDAQVLAQAIRDFSKDAWQASGTYRRETSAEIDSRLELLQRELGARQQSQTALLQRIFAAGVLLNQQLRETNRMLASGVQLGTLQAMELQNQYAHGLSGVRAAVGGGLDDSLAFMDDPRPALNKEEE